MVKWQFINLKCGLCGKKLIVTETNNFKCRYVCEASPNCPNKMYTEMFTKILNKINKLNNSNPDVLENLTSYSWKGAVLGQYYLMEVLRHLPSKITISVKELKDITKTLS